MTHFKKDWFIKGATRLAQGKRFILSAALLPQFLCYCIQSEFIGPSFSISIKNINSKSIIIPL